MIFLKIMLILITIILFITIMYFTAYNNLIIYKTKIDISNQKITEKLKEKYDKMHDFANEINKIIKKKNYLKEFNNIDINNIDNYELDTLLTNNLSTMISLKEDNKSLHTKKCDNIINELYNLDQEIQACKKFFNLNNDELIKLNKGYYKIVFKIAKININNSYEIKEPTNLS